MSRRRCERGSAVVDFTLAVVVLVPLVLGIIHVALVLHVRNTLASAASEGARFAATIDGSEGAGAARTRSEIEGALADRFADDIRTRVESVDGVPTVEVRVAAEIPPLGLWGPATRVEVAGHAVLEQVP